MLCSEEVKASYVFTVDVCVCMTNYVRYIVVQCNNFMYNDEAEAAHMNKATRFYFVFKVHNEALKKPLIE